MKLNRPGRAKKWAPLILGALALHLSSGVSPADAAGLGGSTPAQPALELGYKFFNGPNQATGSKGNLQGSNGYFLNFRAENRKNIARLHAAAQFEFASGSAPISAAGASDSYTLYGAAFLPGVHVYPFLAGRLQPFLGGSAIAGWYMMKRGTDNTQSLSFGYEISAGVDFQIGGAAGNLLRLRSAYSTHSATLGGNTSGVSLNALMFSLGLAY